jgi:hypothetical protein
VIAGIALNPSNSLFLWSMESVPVGPDKRAIPAVVDFDGGVDFFIGNGCADCEGVCGFFGFCGQTLHFKSAGVARLSPTARLVGKLWRPGNVCRLCRFSDPTAIARLADYSGLAKCAAFSTDMEGNV